MWFWHVNAHFRRFWLRWVPTKSNGRSWSACEREVSIRYARTHVNPNVKHLSIRQLGVLKSISFTKGMLSLKYFELTMHYNKCDVIWENPSYGEANSDFLDQPFLYVYIYRLIFFKLCRIGEKCFLQMLIIMWQNVQALTKRSVDCTAPDQSLFVVFLHKPGFHRWPQTCIEYIEPRTTSILWNQFGYDIDVPDKQQLRSEDENTISTYFRETLY